MKDQLVGSNHTCEKLRADERHLNNKLKNAENYNINLEGEFMSLREEVGKLLKELEVKKLEI